MKLSEFKEYFRIRIAILKIGILDAWQNDFAYWANNWGNIASTLAYTGAFILYTNILYAKTKLIAGYTRDEMLIFTFFAQLAFYINGGIFWKNLENLVERVNTGSLDLILIKPFPSLFYVIYQKISLFSLFRDALPPLILLLLVTNWQNLSLNPVNVVVGFLISILGVMIITIFQFFAALPVFWLGESDKIMRLSAFFEHQAGKTVPLEGYDKLFQILFSTLIPVLFTTGISSSVFLGKTPAFEMLSYTIIVLTILIFLQKYFWKIALKNYTSASS